MRGERAAMRVLGLVGLLALTACEAMPAGKEQIDECEQGLIYDLKSPSSYKRIEASASDTELLRPEEIRERLIVGEKAPDGPARIRTVLIEYDASNAYGALLRDRKMCIFLITEAEREAEMRKPIVISRAIEAESVSEFGKSEPYAPECCLD